MITLEDLKELNLTRGEIKVYSAVLELGISTLNKIQEKTGIERRNIYDILNKLIEKGLASYTIEKGKKTYQCTHPNKILEEINRKEESLKKLKDKIPAIIDLFDATKIDVRAEVFRGNESIKALFEDILDYKESHWIGGNSGIEKTSLKAWFGHWMNRRVEKKHWLYDLVDYGTSLEGFEPGKEKIFSSKYYKRRVLPEDLKSPMVIAIFGNKVAQILWGEQPFAFVLESEDAKKSFMKYFQYFWSKR